MNTAVAVHPPWWTRLGIWRLEDTSMTLEEAEVEPLDSLVLQPTPIFTINDIGYYDASAHYVEYPVESEVGVFDHVDVSHGPVPFVLQADYDRIYLGAFITPFSSYLPLHPTITVGLETRNGFVIERGAGEEDRRLDPRLASVLREAGRLLE